MFHLVNFCRLCFTFEGEFINMCLDDTIEKVTACIPDLELDVNLPALICTKCSEQLDKYFQFRNQCLVSEFYLKNYKEKLLANSKPLKFINNKMQVNVLKNFATTNKSLDRNSKLNEFPQRNCTVVLENIKSFVDANLRLNKNSCKVQDFEAYYDKSNPVPCDYVHSEVSNSNISDSNAANASSTFSIDDALELLDFIDSSLNMSRSDYVHSKVSNVADSFSDDDNVLMEKEDEKDTQRKSPSVSLASKHDSAKPKISISEKSKIDRDVNLQETSKSKELSQKVCKVVLEDIRNFVDANLRLNKNSCKAQDFEAYYDKSNPVPCDYVLSEASNSNISDCDTANASSTFSNDDALELLDFIDSSLNMSRSDCVHSKVSNVSDSFSDDDNVLLEKEDENDTQRKSPSDTIASKHNSAKPKISISEESKIDRDVNLHKTSNSNELSQKICKVVLEDIRNFVDANLGLDKNSCKVQDFEAYYNKLNPVSCELQDFEDVDGDDVFLEEEDENDTKPKRPTDVIQKIRRKAQEAKNKAKKEKHHN